jgi:outer membrane protein assembly factor BamB
MTRRAVCYQGWLATILLSLAAVIAAAESESVQPVLIPGGVADADGKTAYVVNPQLHLDVLKLETGEQLWSTQRIRRPLVVSGKRLVALAAPQDKDKPYVIRLVAVDATQPGPALVESEPVELPDWAALEAAGGKAVGLKCRVEGDTAIVAWRADAWYAGSANLSEEELKQARKAASGEIRFDLKTGKTSANVDDKARELTGATTRDAAIGNLRLVFKESLTASALDFGQSFKRSLRATDAKTGAVRWEHPVEGETVVSGLPK